MTRNQDEQRFHDEQADARAADAYGGSLRFDDDRYLDHESWIRPAFAQLGDVRGRHVLDYGCGHGMAAVVLARRGGLVTACDLSAGYVREAAARAAANGVTVTCVQADGERLPFATHTFDAIWGNAILHHLDLPRAAAEIRRVLRPNGVAVFCEPLGDNPLLRFARRALPYPGKGHTPEETPLRWAQTAVLSDHFAHVACEGHQLLAMLRRMLPWRPLDAALRRCDDVLLARWPRWQRWCRYMVVVLRSC